MGADSQVTSARDIFKKARRAGLVVAAAALLGLPAAAHAGTPVPPHELLPDLVQEVPQTLQTQAEPEQPGHFQIGFTSIVGNVGEGPLEIHGTGLGSGADMVAHQVVYMSDSSPKVELPDQIGVVHFETDPTHDHWHFQPFDDYELR